MTAFLKHQSSIHLFTCLIYQTGDNNKEFSRAEFQRVERFFNHPVIIMERPNHRDLEKYAEDNFNEEKHGLSWAELFRSDYIEIHHPGVSDAAPNPGTRDSERGAEKEVSARASWWKVVGSGHGGYAWR
ncbi:uncharacterized protein BKA78DRAFT_379216 [Phyllosticta capitalensis]|uniref:Uncharacterized protein n=1 Tax=Phyllosticta capitalensis TaxID=121624 RepID=A0ABR1YWR5_9PEZI